jgi:hypothetical protein
MAGSVRCWYLGGFQSIAVGSAQVGSGVEGRESG